MHSSTAAPIGRGASTILGGPRRRRPMRLAALALALALVGLALPQLAVARIVFNTIDPVGGVSATGRQLVLTGPISCTLGERAHLRVTVTQRTTGAVAVGRATLRCMGEAQSQQWRVEVRARGRHAFVPGPATAVALARSTRNGATTDVHQWLVNVTLVAP